MVPEAGLEPARSEDHGILSPARLPISPLRQFVIGYATCSLLYHSMITGVNINLVFCLPMRMQVAMSD